jgi:hypothetical protein
MHSSGATSWGVDEGFFYIYEGNMVVGTTLPRCEERLDVNTQCCEPAEQGKKRCRYHGPQVETLEEAAKRAPQFWKGVVKVEADANGTFAAGALKAAGKAAKLTIAERLAERKALNASLKKSDS